ncbi:MAG: DEAD/DEAH box helicase family protein [Parachlamydia sp.]|jgi:superfamily II DNA or RNA helicase|nr:DEAD/DEAH box helicase family protein [Parachlamydia sp.]
MNPTASINNTIKYNNDLKLPQNSKPSNKRPATHFICPPAAKKPKTDQNELQKLKESLKTLTTNVGKLQQLNGRQELPLDIYLDAASEYSGLKKTLNINSDFCSENNRANINHIQFLLDTIHPYPITEEIFEEELRILKVIEQVGKQHHLDYKISSFYIPNLIYDYASWKSLDVARQLREITEEVDPDQTINWPAAIQLLQEETGRYTAAEEANREQSLHSFCVQALATCHERTADLYLDSHLECEDKAEALKKTIHHYEESKKLLKSIKHDVLDIDLSILHARYELAIHYKEKNQNQEYIDQINEIDYLLDIFFTNNIIKANNYISVFYRLAVLEEKYQFSKEERIKEKAKQLITKFSKDRFLKNDKTGKKLDILTWLSTFQRSFGFQIGSSSQREEFTMAKMGEENWIQKRKDQISAGLTALCEKNLSCKYGIKLREHQLDAYRELNTYIQKNDDLANGYFCLPTGAGKTYIMLLQTLAVRMPTLIVVPTTLLMEQTIENIKQISPTTRVSRFDGNAKDRFDGEIMVTTYQSLERDYNSSQRLPLHSFGLVWADEAHTALTSNRAAIFQNLQKSASVIGLTATDTYTNSGWVERTYTKASEVFGPKIYGMNLIQLIEDGSLSPVKNIIVHASNLNINKVNKKKSKDKTADYTNEDLERIAQSTQLNDMVADIYMNESDPYTNEKIFGHSTLVFCVGIDHADSVAYALNRKLPKPSKGVVQWAAAVHSKISQKKREELIELHKLGKIPILVGDKVFAEGYDNPKDRVAFNLRPTRSVVFATQRGGRLLRPSPGKSSALIFDWSYPAFNDQLFFNQLVGNQRWVGIKDDKGPAQEQRATVNYQIDWSPQGVRSPVKRNAIDKINMQQIEDEMQKAHYMPPPSGILFETPAQRCWWLTAPLVNRTSNQFLAKCLLRNNCSPPKTILQEGPLTHFRLNTSPLRNPLRLITSTIS